MTKEESAQPLPPSMSYPPPYGYFPQEDEISLLDLWLVLVKKRKLIFGLTTIATICAVAYALSLPPTYKAEAILLPPTASDIQALNVQGVQGVQGVSIESIYTIFKRNLGSRTLQKQLFIEQGVAEQLAPTSGKENSMEKLFQQFAEMVTIVSNKKNKDRLSLSIEHNDPDHASALVNQLVADADRKTIHQLTSNLHDAVDNRIKGIEYNINSKLKMAKQRRKDQIASLEEAIQIAQTLNIADQLKTNTDIAQEVQLPRNISANLATTPLYYRGTRALHAEANILRQRSNDDHFIYGLRDLQEELVRLRSISIDEGKLHAVTVDQAAYPPAQHIKPKRIMIVVLGFVLGLMLGIFGALFSNFLENQKKDEEAVAV